GEHLLDGGQRSLVDDQLVGVDNDIDIDQVGGSGDHAGNVASGLDHVGAAGDNHSLVGLHGVQEALEGTGLNLVHAQAVHHQQVAGGSLSGQNGHQGQTLHRLAEGVAAIPGLGSEHDTAVGPLRSTGGTLTGVTGALLAPGLAAAAGNLGTGQSALSALTAVGQVILDHIVNDVLVGLDAED